MTQQLLLTVHLHGDGQGTARYHGLSPDGPEWPPAPARVFQALVAGVARGRTLPTDAINAFRWLEKLPPPVIAAPPRTMGQRLALFVPNNDADSLADPRDVAEIRTKKEVWPSLFAEGMPLLYAWSFDEETVEATAIAQAANELYQLGRGVDPAWARAELLGDEELDSRLLAYPGVVHRPSADASAKELLACPAEGSMASLIERHAAVRLKSNGSGPKAHILFINQPKPHFSSVSYAASSSRAVFELRDLSQDKPWPWSQTQPTKLVERCRDAAVARLRDALGEQRHGAIERVLVGRKADGRDDGPIENRVRLVPLPSIGSPHADRAIRRLLVEVPSGGPILAADVMWAFSGLSPAVSEAKPCTLVRTDDESMLGHYRGPSRLWRSVTALALPEATKRRRIDPTRQREEAKGAAERLQEESRAISAMRTALRHAGIRATAVAIRVQREPFDAWGARAEAFAEGTRFSKHRLWHVELELDRPVRGPLVLGDGRFLGLGLMAPASAEFEGLYALSVTDGLVDGAPVEIVARALRNAVMARVQAIIGRERLAPFFSGHALDGRVARGTDSAHLAFLAEPSGRLLIVAPHLLERRASTRSERGHLALLAKALEGFRELRAGRAGRLQLATSSVDGSHDALVRPSRVWRSVTPFTVNRHVKGHDAASALATDVRTECRRVGLPEPRVTSTGLRGAAGVGLVGEVTLAFAVAVTGPIVLGKTRFLGGGVFHAGHGAGDLD